jgi:secreted trypsin-like serine protease
MPSNSVCAPGLVLAILCLPAAQASADSAQAVAGPAPLSTATIQVLGGRQVKEGELPWQVALVMSGAVNHVDGVFCGGTLLDSEWVLTAAHCFFNPETCVEYRQQQYWVA